MARRRQLTEMGRALQAIGAIRSAWLIKNPAGTWSFVGAIPVELCELRKCSVFGTVFDWVENPDGTRTPRNWQTRIYPTREAAAAGMAALGFSLAEDGRVSRVYTEVA